MKGWTLRFLAALGIAALLIAASVADAGPLYGVRGNFGLGVPADLVEIDPATGNLVQVIGLTGLDGVSGLAVHPTTGVLYAAVSGGSISSASNHVLYVLDELTGAATEVGSSYLGVTDMAFDSAGTLYAIDSARNLVTVDLASGAPTVIGAVAMLDGRGVGVGFSSTDQLFLKDRYYLYEVDPATAAILSTVSLTLPAGFLDGMLRNSLAFDENDVLYSVGWSGGQMWGVPSLLVTIDPATGVVTYLGGSIPPNADGAQISAIDFVRGQAETAIPEPATLTLLALGGLGLLRRRRKH